jgi:hypothetical protein
LQTCVMIKDLGTTTMWETPWCLNTNNN